jgi:hypothetical protein
MRSCVAILEAEGPQLRDGVPVAGVSATWSRRMAGMALIKSFERLPDAPASLRSEVTCGWRVGRGGGRTILHLETYGSAGRARKGKVSQAVDIDEGAARDLVAIIKTAFPSLA